MKWRRVFLVVAISAGAGGVAAKLGYDWFQEAAASAKSKQSVWEEGMRRKGIADDLTEAGAWVTWDSRPTSSVMRVDFFNGSSHPKKIDRKTIARLCEADNLERLSIINCDLDWAELAKLRRISKFRSLTLGVGVCDDDLAFLKDLRQLRELQLFKASMVTNAGLVHLRGLTQLEYFYLEGTKVTDAGMEHLKGLRSLQHLDVRHTGVTEQGEQLIRKWLPELMVLY